ncbi:MAG: ATP-binding cassette domain-containing protein [Syntrophomonadaceae bacterium]|nr:ATP-binding cassette domain-containing protein [Syntrophomonadaceae bacterium]
MQNLFSFENIAYRFENNARFIKESGSLQPGGILVLQGPSGAGKSTLLKILARLIKADTGKAFLLGKDWNSFSANEWRLNVNYVSQQPIMFAGSVEDNLLMPFKLNKVKELRTPPALKEIKYYLDRLGLSEPILNQTAKTLSGGEKARIALLRAILINPQVLLLDEPSAYLDQDSRELTMGLLKEWVETKSKGIVMVSHNEEDLTYLDHYTVHSVIPRRHEGE